MRRPAFACLVALACVPHAAVVVATCAPLFACGGRAFTAPELLDAGDVVEDAGGSEVGSEVGSELDDAGDASCVPKTWDPRPCSTSPSYAPHGWPYACGGEGFTGFCCSTPDATCERDAGHD